jgi:glycosyl transferase family 25
MDQIWKKFDAIYCINLKHRVDRYNYSKRIFEKLKIPVKYYQPEKNKNGEAGCFESHIHCIREAYDAKANNVLIFEDDFQLTSNCTLENLQKCVDFMTNNQWDILNLGAVPDLVHFIVEKINHNIFKSHNYYGHSYVLNRAYMEQIRDLKYIGIAIDKIYRYNSNSYAYFPIIFSQASMGSDIINKPTFLSNTDMIEFFRNFFFEFYIRRINYPIGSLAMRLILIMLLLIMYNNPIIFQIGVICILYLLGYMIKRYNEQRVI